MRWTWSNSPDLPPFVNQSLQRLAELLRPLAKDDTSGRLAAEVEVELRTAGAGVVLRTPDGTARYRVSVDNSGNLTTTLVP